jgi:hypothetical protein
MCRIRRQEMYENSAATMREMAGQWERAARLTQPTEVERAITEWRQERVAERRGRWRGVIAKALKALAARLDTAVVAPTPEERATGAAG